MSEENVQATETQASEPASAEPTGTWYDTLPDNLKSAPFFKPDKTPEQIIADLENAAGHLGNSIRIPGPDATDEQRKEFLAKAVEKLPGIMPVPEDDADVETVLEKLGRPKQATDYKLPEGVKPEDLGEGFMADAWGLGLTQKQFTALVNKQVASRQAAQEGAEAFSKETQAALQAEWGAATEDRLSDVRAYLNTEGAPEGMKQAFESGQMDQNTVKWLYSVVEATTEKSQLQEQASGREGRLTPLEAREQAQEIWQKLYEMPPTDPRRPELLAKRRRLVEMYAG